MKIGTISWFINIIKTEWKTETWEQMSAEKALILSSPPSPPQETAKMRK